MEKGAGRGAGREAGPRRQLAEIGSWAGTVGGAGRDLVQEAGLKRGQRGTGSGGGEEEGKTAWAERCGSTRGAWSAPAEGVWQKQSFLLLLVKTQPLGLAKQIQTEQFSVRPLFFYFCCCLGSRFLWS